MTTGWDITKNVEGGGADSAPGSFRVNPYYHDKDRSLLKAELASETPTGNDINPIGDTICIGIYRLD